MLRVNISKFSAKDIYVPTLPDSTVNNRFKKWYLINIDWYITNIIISFNGKINSLINDDLSEVVVATDIENGSIKFDKDFEQVKELNCDLVLKNNKLIITVSSAKFQNFTIDSDRIEMNFLNKEKSVLAIKMVRPQAMLRIV